MYKNLPSQSVSSHGILGLEFFVPKIFLDDTKSGQDKKWLQEGRESGPVVPNLCYPEYTYCYKKTIQAITFTLCFSLSLVQSPCSAPFPQSPYLTHKAHITTFPIVLSPRLNSLYQPRESPIEGLSDELKPSLDVFSTLLSLDRSSASSF